MTVVGEYTRRVYLGDTDASGYPYFGALFNWMHYAETELYRATGHSIADLIGDPVMPVVHAECDYLVPLQLDEVVTVRAMIDALGRSTFAVRYEIRRADGVLAARGRTVSVVVGADGRPGPLPDWLRLPVEPVGAQDFARRLRDTAREVAAPTAGEDVSEDVTKRAGALAQQLMELADEVAGAAGA
jgi:YbgC/YbaW family acyl-CoA thioester hydrolase